MLMTGWNTFFVFFDWRNWFQFEAIDSLTLSEVNLIWHNFFLYRNRLDVELYIEVYNILGINLTLNNKYVNTDYTGVRLDSVMLNNAKT